MTGTRTARAKIYRADPNDLITLQTDVIDPMDTIDTFMGSFLCTSSTRPVAPARFDGMVIKETDTGVFRAFEGLTSLWRMLGTYICTFATRPANPVANDLIFESDFLRLMRWNGSSWAYVLPDLSNMGITEYKSPAAINVAINQVTPNRLPDSGTVIGLVFNAPLSGKVGVQVSGRVTAPGTAGRQAFLGWELRQGNTIGSGTSVQQSVNTGETVGGLFPSTSGSVVAGSALTIISGLTANTPYNLTFIHYNNDAASVCTIDARKMTVVPSF